MISEIAIVQLPPRLAEVVDSEVGGFLRERRDHEIEAIRRWHGADLWLIIAHEISNTNVPAFVDRRVTVGAYSDHPDRLMFIPDIVVTRREGRYVLPPVQAEEADRGQDSLSIFALMGKLGEDERFRRSHRLDKGPIKTALVEVREALRRAWEYTREIDIRDATALLP